MIEMGDGSNVPVAAEAIAGNWHMLKQAPKQKALKCPKDTVRQIHVKHVKDI